MGKNDHVIGEMILIKKSSNHAPKIPWLMQYLFIIDCLIS